ncbi:hypothetical protein L1987_13201 [Smallanthus sonchifolius]|uniref:Uncharacterized protein n=1 Tax=Smallanthus sonchifolius TaxID=185202 RepID=A0ACB9JJD4_9ASTR|nr:hypothetical protein L1987_13201 [Smallanthus sonchifolius]
MNDDILNQIKASYQVTTNENTKDDPFALVVDGKALEIALTNGIKDDFFADGRKMSLAIGDGGNDVGMIQEADIGIGISDMEGMHILYFVYKNIVLGLTLFYYELYSRFSGNVLYDGWYMLMFNLFLTSLPVISLGILEQDVSSDICLQGFAEKCG